MFQLRYDFVTGTKTYIRRIEYEERGGRHNFFGTSVKKPCG